jgi:AbrB family looped-hinge helix DNA binding protein
MVSATMTGKGQVTVPKEIREKLNLKPGDKVEFIHDGDLKVTFYARNLPIEELEGFLAPAKRTVTIEEMNEAIARGAAGE